MTDADLAFADAIRAGAGWNQTVMDWQRFLNLEPSGCFIAEWDGKLAGTATTIVYGPELAWIGMLLVSPEYRLRGIGTALLTRCIDYLHGRDVRCIKLDATPEGKEVYRRLGFKEEWTLRRWERGSIVCVEENPNRKLHSILDAREVEPLDSRVFGVSRQRLITGLMARGLAGYLLKRENGGSEGYGLIRPGARAMYLGPVVAESRESGVCLIDTLVRDRGAVYWDIPDQNQVAAQLARRLGFIPQRSLTRMYLGENLFPGEPSKTFAIAGPEVG